MWKQAVLVVLLSFLFAIALFSSDLQITNSAAPPVPANFEDVAIASVPAPTALAFTPDGRLLITTQPGQIRIYQNGALIATPALNIGSRICTNSERGLLGIAV